MAVTPACYDPIVVDRSEAGQGGVKFFRRAIRSWQGSSLAAQFLFAGGLVALVAMLLVGLLVTSLIERAVTRNAAAATALYVDSVVAPLLPDMQANAVLDDVVRRSAMHEHDDARAFPAAHDVGTTPE